MVFNEIESGWAPSTKTLFDPANHRHWRSRRYLHLHFQMPPSISAHPFPCVHATLGPTQNRMRLQGVGLVYFYHPSIIMQNLHILSSTLWVIFRMFNSGKNPNTSLIVVFAKNRESVGKNSQNSKRFLRDLGNKTGKQEEESAWLTNGRTDLSTNRPTFGDLGAGGRVV